MTPFPTLLDVSPDYSWVQHTLDWLFVFLSLQFLLYEIIISVDTKEKEKTEINDT